MRLLVIAVLITASLVVCEENEVVGSSSEYFAAPESCSARESIAKNLVHQAERYAPVRLSVERESTVWTVRFEADDHDDERHQLAVILQALEVDSNRVVGSWMPSIDNDNDYVLVDCSKPKDTLISKDLDNELSKRRFKWSFDKSEKSFAEFYFIATIVGADGSYWTDVRSDPIQVVVTDSKDVVVQPALVAAQSGQQTDAEVKSRARRNIYRHFQDSTSQCGSRKSCYVSLNTCDVNPDTCNFVLSWEFDGELVNFELTGLSYAWISVAFSQDQYWGDDNLVICSRNADTNRLSIEHYYKRSEDAAQLIRLEPDDHLVNKYITFNQADGFIYCRFSRRRTVENNRYVTDLAQPHFIYIERGAPGEVVGEKINRAFQPSDARIEFANTIHAPLSHRSWLVKVHAILGIIAWIFLASLGILLARYYKPMWPNHVLYHYRVWFSFHRSIMIFVTLLTLLSFLFALIELDWTWSYSGHALLHAVLGLIVIICACINPLLGLFRPSPNTPMRCLFFWVHWLVGTIAFCLAVPAIFIGMDLPKSDVPNWCSWLLFVWVIVHIVVEIVLEIHYCCTFSQLQGNLHEKNLDYDRINKIPIKNANPPGYRWKPTLLFFYAIFTALVVSALVIAILLLDA